MTQKVMEKKARRIKLIQAEREKLDAEQEALETERGQLPAINGGGACGRWSQKAHPKPVLQKQQHRGST